MFLTNFFTKLRIKEHSLIGSSNENHIVSIYDDSLYFFIDFQLNF